MTGKKSTQFYHSWYGSLSKLADRSKEMTCDLMLALLHYGATGEKTEFADFTQDILFNEYAQAIDRDNEKYAKRCETNRNNAIASNRKQSLPIVTDRKQSQAMAADKDKDKDIDKEKDMEKEKDIDDQIRTIIREWNFRKLKKAAITGIPFGQKRYNDTFICIEQYGFGRFMDEIRQLDHNAFFEEWHPSYDWFCNPNNFLKVMEGNYREASKRFVIPSQEGVQADASKEWIERWINDEE